MFRLLPWAEELLRGLLACDVIGFHVRGYATNFLDCVERLLHERVDRKRLILRLWVKMSDWPDPPKTMILHRDRKTRAKEGAPT